MTLSEIETRFAEIRELVASESPDLDVAGLNTEVDALEERKTQLNKKAEERAALIEKAKTSTEVIAQQEERGKNMEEILTREQALAQKDYRSAFFKTFAGEPLNEVEKRVFTETTATFGGALPIETANEIWSNIEEEHPIVGDIKSYRSKSVFEVTVHSAIAAGDAAVTAQGVAPTEEQNTWVKVTLSGKDFAKSVDISYAMGMMSSPVLEDYLVVEISERMGAALAADIIAQITADTAAGNKKTSAAVKATTFAELNGLFALLKASKGAVVYANEATVYNYLTSIVDTTGRPIFQPNMQDGMVGYLLGKPVKLEDACVNNLFYIGNPKKVVGNFIQDIMIEFAKDIKKHVYTYSGYARFECKLTNGLAFVVFTVKQI